MKLFARRTYLDWAAAAPVSKGAHAAFVSALRVYANPGSVHADGVTAAELLESARTTIARLAGTKTESVVFTSGATEANNLAIQGYIRSVLETHAAASVHVLYLPSAHSSTVNVVKALEQEGVRIEQIPLVDGRIDLEGLKATLRPETKLVVLEAVCGETGTRFDTRNVRRVLDAARKNGERIKLHIDASQLPYSESFEHTHLGGDFITLDAQKIGGVRGCGVLIMPRTISLTPLMYGGGQQAGVRPGTEVPALAQACAAALSECASLRKEFLTRAQHMKADAVARIQQLSEVYINGTDTVPHILNISLVGRDTDYLQMLLDKDGFAVSTKSACETDAEGSRAVFALTGDADRALSTLRISWGPTTTEREVRAGIAALVKNVRFLDETRS